MNIEARLARLEAELEVRSAFARYVFLMDAGHVDELIELFTEDAEFGAENEPPGSGGRVTHHGRHAIDGHYRPLPFGWFRHHASNLSIDVDEHADRADVSSYFLTTYPGGVQGGVYEGEFVRDRDGRWRIRHWHIASTWGWGVEPAFQYFHPLAQGTLGGGKPVVWTPHTAASATGHH